MKIKALLAALGIALTVLVGGVTSPAAAAPAGGCGSTCEGQDPNQFRAYFDGLGYTCAQDAVIMKTAKPELGVTVELKYSPRCHTAWAKVSSPYYEPEIVSYYTSGAVRTRHYGRVSGGSWTLMTNDAGLLASACTYYGPTSACTAKY